MFAVFFIVSTISTKNNTVLDENNKYYINAKARSSQSGQPSAPENLTGLVIDAGVLPDKGLNAAISGFQSEWQYQFSRVLPIITINASKSLGGLSNITIARTTFNGTLFWWNASKVLSTMADNPLPIVNRSANSQDTLLAPWRNGTATGWVMDAGCNDTMQRFTAYQSIVLNRFENWTSAFKKMRFSIQLDSMGWMTPLPSVESTFSLFVAREISCVELPAAPLNEIANISLPGFNNGWSAADISQRASYLDWLASVLQLAAQFHVRVFLSSDELVMTQPMYDWLNTQLGYSGSAYGAEDSQQFPASVYDKAISPDSPVWILLAAKYQAVIDAVKTILNSTNTGAFGGLKFRIDDISDKNWQGQDVYKKVSFMHTVATLGKFINITTAAAAEVNAWVIQRMWMLGDAQSPFNNATLCHQMLDPIKATNLILRTKETWNDHWLNSPANPTIGISHHPWIIGFAVNSVLPYYRGFLYDWYSENGTKYNYGNGTLVGWWDNPNIIGYDSILSTWASWQTLASQYAMSYATIFYLVQHSYNASIRAGESLKTYFAKVGITSAPILQNLTRIFQLSVEAFRQLFFMKAWSSSGTFRGDVVNDGNDLKFDPVNFNKFYLTLPNYGGMPGVDYTLQEGYNGSATAKQMADLCPDSYPGYGKLDDSPAFVFNASSVDSANLTSVLGYFRENMRAYAAFADLFADWRAWHVEEYNWLYTWDPGSYQAAEQARASVIAKHQAYQQKYTPKGWGFIYTYSQLEGSWMVLVGNAGIVRSDLAWAIVCAILVWIAAIYAYRTKGASYKDHLLAMLGASRWRKRDSSTIFVSPREYPARWLAGTVGVPAGVILGWIAMFGGLFAWQELALSMPFFVLLSGYTIGVRAGAAISQGIGKRDWRSMHALGVAMMWQWVLLVLFSLLFLAAGSIMPLLAIDSSGFYMLAGITLGCSILGIWSFMRNIVYKNKRHAIATFFIIVGCIAASVYLLSLVAGGIGNIIDNFTYALNHLNG